MNKKNVEEENKSKELITILLAIYNPNVKWFIELLHSLNKQTYNNLELIVCDDASKEVSLDCIKKLLKENISAFPYKVLQNKKNMGSNWTFIHLISEAHGKYIAFCDQDDVWRKDKIEILYYLLKNKKAILSYCNMQVINEKGTVIYKNLKQQRKRINYVHGDNLVHSYIFRNCTAGCSMLVSREIANLAKEIPEGTYWDHWICVLASLHGKIVFSPKRLVKYRIHKNNQSGVLAGINSWDEYYNERVNGLYQRVHMVHQKGYTYQNQRKIEAVAQARKNGNIYLMWKYKYLCRNEVYFEILFRKTPKKFFQLIKTILCKW